MPHSVNPTVAGVIDRSVDEMHPPNSTVYDGARARLGYRLNRFAFSLKQPENRAAFGADAKAYMARFDLTEHEQSLVHAQDWAGLVDAGGNIYALVKLLGSVGSNLVTAGLQMRNEAPEPFRRSRPIHQGGG